MSLCIVRAWRALLAVVASDDTKQLLEFFAAEAKRPHVRSDEVFPEIFVHLDDHRTNQSRLGHHEMIALGSGLHAACKLADVTQLLPRNAFHAVALRSVAASYAGIVK